MMELVGGGYGENVGEWICRAARQREQRTTFGSNVSLLLDEHDSFVCLIVCLFSKNNDSCYCSFMCRGYCRFKCGASLNQHHFNLTCS